MSGQKILNCANCGEDKPHCAKGLCYNCYNKQDYQKHKKKRQMTHNKWVEGNREKMNEYNRVSYNKNKEERLVSKAVYYLENKTYINSRQKKWRNTEKGKEIKRMCSRKRRALLNDVVHSFTYDEWVLKLRESQGVCQSCNEYVGIENLTLDHIIPISKAKKGQVYSIDDIQPLCKTCNCKKSNKMIYETKAIKVAF